MPAYGYGKVHFADMTDTTTTFDLGGAVLHNKTYRPYGQEIVLAGSQPNRLGFQQKQREHAFDLDGAPLVGAPVNFGARVYDPDSRQFLSPDPLRWEGVGDVLEGYNTLQPFVFAASNPTSFKEMAGLKPEAIFADYAPMMVRIGLMNLCVAHCKGDSLFGPVTVTRYDTVERSEAAKSRDTLEAGLSTAFELAASFAMMRGSRAAIPPRATVKELVDQMNRRPNTVAEFATGDAERYLRAIDAEGSHTLLEGGRSHILLRADVASRRTAFHEWLHRSLQRTAGGPRPGEDRIIESFLDRHRRFLGLN